MKKGHEVQMLEDDTAGRQLQDSGGDQPTSRVLARLGEYARSKGLNRKGLARALGLPYNTVKKWFCGGDKRRAPSPANVAVIERYLGAETHAKAALSDVWSEVLRWWRTQHRFRTVDELADAVGWDRSLETYLTSNTPPPRLVVERLSAIAGLSKAQVEEERSLARRRVRTLTRLLLILEDELRWFRDSSAAARDVLREELDTDDLGYITSLLTMFGDEDKFKRWLSLTTNRFGSFARKRSSR